MDLIATPYDDAAHHLITGGPFDHFAHIVAYAAQQASPHGPQGIASYPWRWLLDLSRSSTCDQPVAARRRACTRSTRCRVPGDGQPADPRCWRSRRCCSAATGAASPPARPRDARRRRRSLGDRAAGDPRAGLVSRHLGAVRAAEPDRQRTSYLYYMVIVMPGHLRRGRYLMSLGWRARSADLGAVAVAVWGVCRGRGGGAHVPVRRRCSSAAVRAAAPATSASATPRPATSRLAAGHVEHRARRRACASRSAGGGRSCGVRRFIASTSPASSSSNPSALRAVGRGAGGVRAADLVLRRRRRASRPRARRSARTGPRAPSSARPAASGGARRRRPQLGLRSGAAPARRCPAARARGRSAGGRWARSRGAAHGARAASVACSALGAALLELGQPALAHPLGRRRAQAQLGQRGPQVQAGAADDDRPRGRRRAARRSRRGPARRTGRR